MPYVHISADDFDDEDLIDELESRGYKVDSQPDGDTYELIRQIFEKRRVGGDYQRELDTLIYDIIGRIV